MDSDLDFGRLIVLLILVVPTIAWLYVEYRRRIHDALKHVLMWIGIVMCFMLIYTYRADIFQITDKVVATFLPGTIEQTSANEIKVYRQRDNHFYLKAKLNGETVTFLFDTGATLTSIARQTAEAAGVDVEKLVFNVPFQTANGIRKAALANIERLTIGAFEARNVKVAVFDSKRNDINLLGTNVINLFNDASISGNELKLTY